MGTEIARPPTNNFKPNENQNRAKMETDCVIVSFYVIQKELFYFVSSVPFKASNGTFKQGFHDPT